MFTHKAIAELNALEMMVYNYVIKNKNPVMYMTIRELAEAAGVSTTTVLRFCKKMGCEGIPIPYPFQAVSGTGGSDADGFWHQ